MVKQLYCVAKNLKNIEIYLSYVYIGTHYEVHNAIKYMQKHRVC